MKNTTKETQSVVDVFYRDRKFKGVSRPVAYEGEKYIVKENEMIFYLRENPDCQVYAVGVWRENMLGKIIGDVDTYFIHILTGRRCESLRECFSGWSEQDEKSAEEWETLCIRIQNHENIEEDMCYEKRVEV